MDNYAINISNLSKRFIKMPLRISKIFEVLIKRNRDSLQGKWVLDNINLNVKRGVVLGIVGLNGAGKTTLLKIMAGIMKATTGVCEINGKVACCISFLDGFYLDLSLKDNLYVYGAFLGLARSRLDNLFNSNDELKSIKPFLDLNLYKCSSGVVSRAVFILTIFSEADIMLFDEVPMSTDINFQRIAINLLNNLKRENKTIVMSSHSPYFLEQICDEAILLEEGKLTNFGRIEEVLDIYKDEKGI